nr:transposase [Micromonospora sediminimaris]
MFNAVLYAKRTGIAWHYLPHGFPPHATVYGYFAAWSKQGIFTDLNYQLTGLVRAITAAPSNPLRPSETNPRRDDLRQRPTGHPGHRRRQEIVGRERGIITDTFGLLLAVIVTAASASDSASDSNLPKLTKTGSTPD